MKNYQFLALPTLLLGLMSATPALALTNQQLLNNSFAKLSISSLENITGEVNVRIDLKGLEKNAIAKQQMKIVLGFSDRVVKSQTGTKNSEGSLTIKAISIFSPDSSEVQFSTNEPIKALWKTVEGKSYLNIGTLPAPLIEMLKSMQIDLSPITNQWILLDDGQKLSSNQILDGLAISSQTADGSITGMLDAGGIKNPILYTGVEKSWTNAAGDKIIRLRAKLNTAMAYAEYQQNLKAAYKITNRTNRTTAIKDAYKSYTEKLKSLKAVRLAVNINTTKQIMERLELAAVDSKPEQSCNFDAKDNYVCKTTGNRITTVNAGITFLPANSEPISAPSSYITMQQVQEWITVTNQ